MNTPVLKTDDERAFYASILYFEWALSDKDQFCLHQAAARIQNLSARVTPELLTWATTEFGWSWSTIS